MWRFHNCNKKKKINNFILEYMKIKKTQTIKKSNMPNNTKEEVSEYYYKLPKLMNYEKF